MARTKLATQGLRGASLGALLTALAPGAVAQDLSWSVTGNFAANTFGGAVAVAGDVNGDGFDDVVVGDLDASPVAFHEGQAKVLSGLDGTELHSFDGWTGLQGLGVAVDGAGDVDADGFQDVVVASLQDVPVVYSGVDGSTLFVMSAVGGSPPPDVVAGVGDLNGDGFDDVAVGAGTRKVNNLSQAGRVWVVSGAFMSNGTPPQFLATFDGSQAGAELGSAIASAGDVDGDGWPDLLVAAPGESGLINNFFYCGVVRLISGQTLLATRTHRNFGSCIGFGRSLAGLGDLDLDGHDEIAIGAPYAFPNGNDSGWVGVYAGASGTLLFDLLGNSAGDLFGDSVCGVGDASGDGYPDVLVGAPGDNAAGGGGACWLYSGQDGTPLALLGEQGGSYGRAVSGDGDFDGDGYADFVVGAPWVSGRGEVYAYGGHCLGGDTAYCVGAGNSVSIDGAVLSVSGSLSVAQANLTLVAQQCPPGQFGIFFYGPSAVQVPLGDGFLCVGGALYRLKPPVPIDAVGTASLQVDFSDAPAGDGPGAIHGGDTWHFQFWYRDPLGPGGTGSNLTDAHRLVFCP